MYYDISADPQLNHIVLVEKFSEKMRMYLGKVEMRLNVTKGPGKKAHTEELKYVVCFKESVLAVNRGKRLNLHYECNFWSAVFTY